MTPKQAAKKTRKAISILQEIIDKCYYVHEIKLHVTTKDAKGEILIPNIIEHKSNKN